VEKVRISDLKKGDRFEMNGNTWKVIRVEGGRIYYRQYMRGKKWRDRWGSALYSAGARSMQFVNLEKRVYEQNSSVVGQDKAAKDSGDGQGADQKYTG
jgi:hypothetical protein